MNKYLPILIFKSVALGLGIGVVVLSGMNKINMNDSIKLLSLSVTFLAASSLGESSLSSKNIKEDKSN